MGQVRDVILDNSHEQIAEGRELISRGRELEKEGTGIALQRHMKRGSKSYRHAGVETVFVEGVSKLRVRLTKEAENTVSTGDGRPELAEVEDMNEVEDADPALDDLDTGDTQH